MSAFGSSGMRLSTFKFLLRLSVKLMLSRAQFYSFYIYSNMYVFCFFPRSQYDFVHVFSTVFVALLVAASIIICIYSCSFCLRSYCSTCFSVSLLGLFAIRIVSEARSFLIIYPKWAIAMAFKLVIYLHGDPANPEDLFIGWQIQPDLLAVSNRLLMEKRCNFSSDFSRNSSLYMYRSKQHMSKRIGIFQSSSASPLRPFFAFRILTMLKGKSRLLLSGWRFISSMFM